MPIYEYECRRCKLKFDLYRKFADSDRAAKCQNCNGRARKLISLPNLRTDTSFFATGCVDPRVCENGDDRIEGRKDWKRRLEKKGLRELDWAEVKDPKMPKPTPVFSD